MSDRPPYRVPSMAEVREIPWNGLTACSTFAGAGGSSTGYRMAGYRIAWSSEFIGEAAATYRANARPETVLDTRDIRDVDPLEVLASLGMEPGQLDLLDGSPPCSAFSTAGVREQGWGRTKAYSDSAQRVDDLFWEFARFVRAMQPRAFVAENVSGLIKGVAKGYFKRILTELRDCGYRVEARLLDAQWLGVPQARQRLIFIGVRTDLSRPPVHPSPLPYRYTVREVLGPSLERQGAAATFGDHSWAATDRPSPTLGASPTTGNGRSPASQVIERIPAYYKDTRGQFVSGGDASDRPSPTIVATPADSGHYIVATEQGHPGPVWRDGQPYCPETGAKLTVGGRSTFRLPPGTIRRRLTIPELRLLSSFPADFILTGTYGQRWERCGRAVPPLMMRAIAETLARDVLCAG